jgi:hypothetical protein
MPPSYSGERASMATQRLKVPNGVGAASIMRLSRTLVLARAADQEVVGRHSPHCGPQASRSHSD